MKGQLDTVLAIGGVDGDLHFNGSYAVDTVDLGSVGREEFTGLPGASRSGVTLGHAGREGGVDEGIVSDDEIREDTSCGNHTVTRV